MLPISRYIGGVTRPRDLRVISSSRGGRLKPGQSSDTDSPLLERVPNTPRGFESPQVLQCAVDVPDGTTDWLIEQSQKSEGSATLGSGPPKNTEVQQCSVNAQPRRVPVVHSSTSPLARSVHPLPSASQQARVFHTSPCVPYDSTSYNVADVPDFFVKYKQHRATSSTDLGVGEREVEEMGLMESLSDSILTGDIIASTRRLKAKIPIEHHVTEGRVVHSSGFVVPGPGHLSTSDVARAKERERNEKKDRAVQTAAVAHRVLESGFEQVDATTIPHLHKVPFEVHEPDGIVRHPSGFMPPTPAHKFRYPTHSVRLPSPTRAVLRAMHTTSEPRACGDVQGDMVKEGKHPNRLEHNEPSLEVDDQEAPR